MTGGVLPLHQQQQVLAPAVAAMLPLAVQDSLVVLLGALLLINCCNPITRQRLREVSEQVQARRRQRESRRRNNNWGQKSLLGRSSSTPPQSPSLLARGSRDGAPVRAYGTPE